MHSRAIVTRSLAALIAGAAMRSVHATQPIPSDTTDTVSQHHHPATGTQVNMNAPYGYRAQWIDQEFCATIDEQACQQIDEAYGVEVQKKQKIIRDINEQRRRQRRTQVDGEAATNDDEQRNLQLLTPVGSFKVLVLLMRWSDHASVETVQRQDYDRMFNAEPDDIGSRVIPTGSVRRYFETSSYGKLTFEAEVIDWQTTDNTEAFYAGPNRGLNPNLQQSMVPILENIESNGFDFNTVDGDGDGIIDLIVVLHSGYASEEGGTDCRFGTVPDDRIQSHSTAATETTLTWRSLSGLRVGQYAFASAFRLRCDANIARLGVPTHEMFHNFGLLDLYDNDVSPDLQTSGNIGGIDRFGLMANTAGQRNNKSRPGHLSAWSKERLGFVEPTMITTDGTYTARPVELQPDIFRVDLSDSEYLLIENRQPIPDDFDEFFFGEGGIVIYKIDKAITEPRRGGFRGNRDRGFPAQGDWPSSFNHYGVAVLQADSIGTPGGRMGYQLEQYTSGGGDEDLWISDTQSLGPGTAEDLASADIFPNTDLYSSATGLGVSGVTVNNFRRMPGQSEGPYTYMFDVVGLLAGETPNPSASPSASPTTEQPSAVPSAAPSQVPSAVVASEIPSQTPTADAASESPSQTPTAVEPSDVPSQVPTAASVITESPSLSPSQVPTTGGAEVSASPSVPPSSSPSQVPTEVSVATSASPSIVPTAATDAASSTPSAQAASAVPSSSPSSTPSDKPTLNMMTMESPSAVPSAAPTTSSVPTIAATSAAPSQAPTTAAPSVSPSMVPTQPPTTSMPTRSPSQIPSSSPSTIIPTISPSRLPSQTPTIFVPSVSPSSLPTAPVPQPTRSPGLKPSSAGGETVIKDIGPIFPTSPSSSPAAKRDALPSGFIFQPRRQTPPSNGRNLGENGNESAGFPVAATDPTTAATNSSSRRRGSRSRGSSRRLQQSQRSVKFPTHAETTPEK